MSSRISFKVEGRVQGVCFRAFTVEQANSLGVTGHCENASDGTVIGEAQGESKALQQLVKHLEKGPSAARVENVNVKDIPTKESESTFTQ